VRKHAIVTSVCLLAASAAGCSQAGEVRSTAAIRVAAVSDIHPTVQVRASIDARLHCPVLEFDVGNLSDAGNRIAAFAVGNMQRPGAVRSPAQWRARYGAMDNDSCVYWACLDTLTPLPQGHSGLNAYPSPYMIDPADTAHTFRIFTRQLPRVIRYWAWGFDTLPGPGQSDPMTFGNAWAGQIDVRDVIGIVGTEPPRVPKMVELEDPAPNPSRGRVSVAYSLPRRSGVRLLVYDVSGKLVRTLASGPQEEGLHIAVWDGYTNQGVVCPPGKYFARLSVDGRAVGARQVTILK
jgi:hypothetical protein